MEDSAKPKEENQENVISELLMKSILRQLDVSMAISSEMIKNADVLIYDPIKFSESYATNLKLIESTLGLLLSYQKRSTQPVDIEKAKEAVTKANEKAFGANILL